MPKYTQRINDTVNNERYEHTQIYISVQDSVSKAENQVNC